MPKGEGWDLPEGIEPWSTFHWFKIGARQGLDCVILSERPFWYVGHFHDNRMWPCGKPQCSLCEEGVGGQARYVFSVVCTTSRRVGLLEVSQSVAQVIRSWIERAGGLRGMHVFFGRHSHSIKSRMEVDFVEGELIPWFRDLEVPDPAEAMELTWSKMHAKTPRSETVAPGARFGSQQRRAS